MKRLIAIATLGLALSFPSFSYADSYIFGVRTPIVKTEVKNEVKGGMVEKDFISFYLSPKEANTETSLMTEQEVNEDNSYIVFGVRVPINTKS